MLLPLAVLGGLPACGGGGGSSETPTSDLSTTGLQQALAGYTALRVATSLPLLWPLSLGQLGCDVGGHRESTTGLPAGFGTLLQDCRSGLDPQTAYSGSFNGSAYVFNGLQLALDLAGRPLAVVPATVMTLDEVQADLGTPASDTALPPLSAWGRLQALDFTVGAASTYRLQDLRLGDGGAAPLTRTPGDDGPQVHLPAASGPVRLGTTTLTLQVSHPLAWRGQAMPTEGTLQITPDGAAALTLTFLPDDRLSLSRGGQRLDLHWQDPQVQAALSAVTH
ncbi:hypothetical protein [Ideonella livida]|uniref:Uncharacterized protein n=1 Tax=Ideonella livida TaxID=2707176 RepID=A0A7C9TJQ7_9BURK|nr:hypothetical protein [Ideonella livida]NDY90407.1 hypothetical protein [Ideonella livida]